MKEKYIRKETARKLAQVGGSKLMLSEVILVAKLLTLLVEKNILTEEERENLLRVSANETPLLMREIEKIYKEEIE